MALAAVLGFAPSLEAQTRLFGLGAGVGAVLRDDRQGTLGYHLTASGHWRISQGVLLGLEVMGESYAPWQFGGDLCPPGGCPPKREDRTLVGGLILSTMLLRSDPAQDASRLYPIAGLGLYAVNESSETIAHPGLTGGLGVELLDHLHLAARVHWVAGDSRVTALFPLSLTWTF